MSHAPLSSLSVPASSAGGPVVEVVHACARHPALRGEQGCTACSAALCSACARSTPHSRCPDCRVRAGEPAHVVDVGWRVQLLLDAMALSFRAIPRRVPALVAVLAVSLLASLVLYAIEGDADEDAAIGLAVFFGMAVFGLGAFFQPLLVVPSLAPVSKLRVVAGALVGFAVCWAPLVAAAIAAVVAEDGGDSDTAGAVVGLASLVVAAVGVPVALVFQGRAVMGRGPGLGGLFGAVVAHAVYASLFAFVFSFIWLPITVVVVAGYVVSPAVAGVVGVVCGLFVWLGLLIGMGSFAAASARYSADLELR